MEFDDGGGTSGRFVPFGSLVEIGWIIGANWDGTRFCVGMLVGLFGGITHAGMGMDAQCPAQAKIGHFDGHLLSIGVEHVARWWW